MCRHVPEANGRVVAAGRQPSAIWAERHASHGSGMALHGFAPGLPTRNIPQADGVVLTRGCEGLSVGTEGHARYPARLPDDGRADQGTGRRVPEHHRA